MRTSKTNQNQITNGQDANKVNLRNEIQETYRSQPEAWFPWLFDRLNLSQEARILELGCGPGQFWKENEGRVSERRQPVLSDREYAMVQHAKASLADLSFTRFLCLDGGHLPFANESFDFVLAIGVLDLVPDPQHAILEIWRVLRPSGELAATAGGKNHLKELREVLKSLVPDQQAESLGGVEERFGLENGASLLATTFQEVIRSNYSDQLRLTDIQPVLDYIFSEDDILESLTLPQLGLLVQRLKRQLQKRGKISITIQKGLFIARKKLTNDLNRQK